MTPVGRIVGLWFSEKRGSVIGISMMGTFFGGIIIPAIIGVAVSSHGWHNGYFFQAGITAIVAIFTFTALRKLVSEGAPSMHTHVDSLPVNVNLMTCQFMPC